MTVKVNYLEGSVFQHFTFQNTPTRPCRLLLVCMSLFLLSVYRKVFICFPSVPWGQGGCWLRGLGNHHHSRRKWINEKDIYPVESLENASTDSPPVRLHCFLPTLRSHFLCVVCDPLHLTRRTFHLKSSADTTNQYAQQQRNGHRKWGHIQNGILCGHKEERSYVACRKIVVGGWRNTQLSRSQNDKSLFSRLWLLDFR